MGKCKFNENWLDNPLFASWLVPVKDHYEARCKLCKKIFKLGTMGVKAVESHMLSAKHTSAKTRLQTTISHFFSAPASTSTAPSQVGLPPATPIITSAPTEVRITFGSTPTLEAEVLWVLNTVAKHQSYNGNDGLGEVFRAMFPDSEIAKTLTCGKDKTSYIARFGLAPYIQNNLFTDVNKDTFVLMFDESFNQTTKTKQLDLHVRYWDKDQVRSRYLGSQFMGHGTARDLLRHFKVSSEKLSS